MFEVRWTKSALDDLAHIWLDASSAERRAITAATDQLDAVLSNAPDHQGESRSGNRRILFAPLLVVVFSVDKERSQVRILRCWRYGRD